MLKEMTDMQITEELAWYLKDTVYRTNMNTDIYKHMVNLIFEQQKRIKKSGILIYPYPDGVERGDLVCVSCGHSENYHFEGSYNDKAERGVFSECGCELQFVCGCHSQEFRTK